MNILWSSMLLLGIAYGALQGRIPEVTDRVIPASREAVGRVDGDCEEGGSD